MNIELIKPIEYINNKYHCNKCNKQFNKKNIILHLNSQEHGAGIGDWIKEKYKNIKNVFSKRLTMNNTTKKSMEIYGKLKIINLTIAKKPVHKLLMYAVNLLTLGKFNELKNYDKFYHLGLILHLENNQKLMFEKVDEVMLYEKITIRPTDKDAEFMDVKPNILMSIDDLVKNTINRMTEHNFYDYDAFNNNCQIFLKNLLQTLGSWNIKTENFVLQDVSYMLEHIPSLSHKIINQITSFANIKSKWSGAGKINNIQDNFVINSVVVRKPISKEELSKIQKEFTKNKFIRETKQSFRIRVNPKTRFQKGTFKTKIIQKKPYHISLVMGQLK